MADETKKINNKNIKQLFEQYASLGQLRHYTDFPRKYVSECLQKGYLVEAYCISLQYIEDVITSSIDETGNLQKAILEGNKLNFRNIIPILESMNMINKEFQSNFDKLLQLRNEIAHCMIKDINTVEKYNKQEYFDLPTKCMNMVDQFLVNQALDNFKNKSKHELLERQTEKMTKIAIQRLILREGQAAFSNASSEDNFKKVKKEWLIMLNGKF